MFILGASVTFVFTLPASVWTRTVHGHQRYTSRGAYRFQPSIMGTQTTTVHHLPTLASSSITESTMVYTLKISSKQPVCRMEPSLKLLVHHEDRSYSSISPNPSPHPNSRRREYHATSEVPKAQYQRCTLQYNVHARLHHIHN